MADESQYPALLPDTSFLPVPKNVNEQSSLEEVIQADVVIANANLQIIHQLWGNVTSIAAACKLLDQQMKAVEHRRKVLNLQYGAKDSSQKSDVVLPIP